MKSRLLFLALFAGLLALSMGACDKGKGTGKEDDTWTWDRCTTEGWDTTQDYFQTCDTLAFDWFAEDCEWDNDSSMLPSREISLKSSDLFLYGIKKVSPRISKLYWVWQVTVKWSPHLEELPSEIWEIQRLESIVIDSVPSLKIIHDIPRPVYVTKMTLIRTNPKLPSNLNLAPINNFFWEMMHQNVTEIPEELRNLYAVRGLYLYHGKFSEIPEWLIELTQLRDLQIKGLIREFPDELLLLPHLKDLGIGDELTRYPEKACAYPEMDVRLSWNKICSRDSIPSCVDSATANRIIQTQQCN